MPLDIFIQVSLTQVSWTLSTASVMPKLTYLQPDLACGIRHSLVPRVVSSG